MAGYTRVEDLDHAAVAAAYGWSQATLTPLKGGAANSTFTVDTGVDQVALTVLDNHDQASATALVHNIRLLQQRGVRTTELTPDRSGRFVVPLAGRLLLVKRWLPGKVLEPFPVELLSSAGAALARLHQIPADGFEVALHGRRLSDTQVAEIAGFEDRPFADWLTATLALVEKDDANGTNTLCHGDLFADNVVVHGEQITLIDWETLALDDPLLDLGMSVVGLARTGRELPRQCLDLLIAGYEQVRALAPAERERLPLQIVHAAAIIGFHRYHRHVVRIPDPTRALYHREMQDFASSLHLC